MCTSFLLKGSDGGAVYGRSMEFGMPLNSQLMISPRGYSFEGNGMHGLPGDYLSTSRFIRALFLSKSVPASYNTEKMVNAAWHITGSFDIPPGAITLTADNPYGGGVDGLEITEWIIVADNKNKIYNVKMFDTTNVYAFDLKKANFDAKDLTYFKLDKPQMPIALN
jgi:choloylglycine hydrolase